MNTHFAGIDIQVNTLRGELISRSRNGNKKASELLKAISRRSETTAGELVTNLYREAGSSTVETFMAGLGLLCVGLVLGVIALLFSGMVSSDLETLLVMGFAFIFGHWGLATYHRKSVARYHAQEFQQLANIVKASALVKERYEAAARKAHKKMNLQRAFGYVA